MNTWVLMVIYLGYAQFGDGPPAMAGAIAMHDFDDKAACEKAEDFVNKSKASLKVGITAACFPKSSRSKQ